MMNRKRVFWATTALFSGLLVAGAASAQSSGTEAAELDEVVVTGATGPRNVDGLAVSETVAKTRNTITQEFIATQTPGQTILQTLNLTPGLSFTNTDSYGSSGGNIRLRGFDGNRVSLTFDGIPLNDTGNYASYTNQQLDPELIERASVNTGSTDVDSPTAAATGGTINYVTLRPTADFGGWGQFSYGDFNYRRYMALINTGEFGPWGTSAWFAVSSTNYDKFKGRGDLQKTQFNGRIYQPLGDNGDFLSLSGNWNENRNNNYLGPNLGTATGSILPQVETDPRGWDVDFDTTYVAPTVRAGLADVDSNGTNYWGLRVNPSNTGSIRGQSRFTLSDSLVLTIDPSFQYTLANGGTQQLNLSESDRTLRGTFTTGGVDLNGDGDTLDTVRVMTPSNTNTHRYGLNSSLIWDLDNNHRLRAAYALDFGRHRQTGLYGRVNFSNPNDPRFIDWFGGRNILENRIVNRNGYELRSRDRLSIAELNQFSLEYRGQFMDDALTINIGVRAPFFRRELNQFCLTQNSSSNVLCTSETTTTTAIVNGVSTTLTNGNLAIAGRTTGSGATLNSIQYIAPYSRDVEYEDILPNVGATYRWGEGHSVYVNYAETLSAPRTDSLYGVRRFADGTVGNPTVQPESAQNFDLGYRYTVPNLVGTVSVFANSEENRIVSSFDDDLGQFVDRNVGAVERIGAEGSIGWSPIEALSLYASATWLSSEVQDDYVNNTVGGIPQIVLTKGKELVETPEWMASARINYQFTEYLEAGLQAKYTGERWVTDVNDMSADAFTTVDANIRLDMAAFGYEGTFIQVNADNIFDEQYYANLGTRASSTPGTPGFSQPFASVGAPRTISATLRVAF